MSVHQSGAAFEHPPINRVSKPGRSVYGDMQKTSFADRFAVGLNPPITLSEHGVSSETRWMLPVDLSQNPKRKEFGAVQIRSTRRTFPRFSIGKDQLHPTFPKGATCHHSSIGQLCVSCVSIIMVESNF